MELDTFWRFITRARADAGEDPTEIAGLVMELLVQESIETIVDFDRTLYKLLAHCYTRELWAAAAIINYGTSEDGFENFRAWLVAQGERNFYAAIEDADSLADVAKPDATAECEEMLFVAQYAYERRTGREMSVPHREIELDDVTVPTDDQLSAICPLLWTTFSA